MKKWQRGILALALLRSKNHSSFLVVLKNPGAQDWDTNYFAPLVEATVEHFQLREVSADKAYQSRNNLKALERLGGTPFAPFKRNTLEPTPDEDLV